MPKKKIQQVQKQPILVVEEASDLSIASLRNYADEKRVDFESLYFETVLDWSGCYYESDTPSAKVNVYGFEKAI